MSSWILVTELRRKLLPWWNASAALVFLCFLVMFVNNKFEAIEGTAWLWFVISVLPGLVLLNAGAWINRSPDKIVPPGASRALFSLTVGYLGALLLTLLFSQAAIERREDYGLDAYLLRSLFYLLPLHALVAAGLWILFFRKENLFRPNPKIITATAAGKARDAVRHGWVTQARCYELVAADRLPDVFDLLQASFSPPNETGRMTELVMIQHQYHQLRKDKDLNLIDPELAQRTLNRITAALLNLTATVQS
jgi:hypothetical protein